MAAAGGRKPGSPRDAESELRSRRVRELAGAGPGNRYCFECGQRGVTYVDITLGSFVCTGCSGALRGLNPPHRVKSISMTTFTEAEVLFLQSRGNEACRKVWLCSFDPRTSLLPDSRDPQKVKEFLQEKYEKKRWYVPVDQNKGTASLASQSSTPEVKPQQALLGDSGMLLTAAGSSRGLGQPHQPQQRTPQPAKKASTDLLADIGGDPFAAPQPAPAFAMFPALVGLPPAHTAFANFEAFGSSPVASTFGGGSVPFHTHPMPAASQSVPGSYSFGGAQVSSFGASPTSYPSSGIPEMGAAPSSLFGTLSQPALPVPSPAPGYGASTNPFAVPAALPARTSTNPFQPSSTVPDGHSVHTFCHQAPSYQSVLIATCLALGWQCPSCPVGAGCCSDRSSPRCPDAAGMAWTNCFNCEGL
nr:arf-GAP domain and FG repeat-containing protein 2 isoform X2 [Pelodiscus sinensis]|eukprot:XP_006114714.1 arf-GAP domain and FG repeat-containing protein 2 isoform X2 [Pelodiscus sinensis]